MQRFNIILATSAFVLTSCSFLDTRTVDKSVVCRDVWYGHVCPDADVSRDLLYALQPEIANGTILVHQSGEVVTINLASSLLFDSGDEQLKAAGAEALERVGSVLKNFPDTQIYVSGYTDNVPIMGALQKKFPSNRELSEARAHSAAHALREGGVRSKLTTFGYADQHAIASNDTAEGRVKNRRVEIAVIL